MLCAKEMGEETLGIWAEIIVLNNQQEAAMLLLLLGSDSTSE